ncbi:MAG: SDR family oxidoreductase [Chthoniobacterales bacterium]|nr:SDR family oxidoreductase [Chthoniobacterales bacterium]
MFDTGGHIGHRVPMREFSPERDPLFDLTQQTILVFGACGGIGEAVATGLAERGARLLVSDVNGAAARALAERLPRGVAPVASAECDVRSDDSVASVFKHALEEFGRVTAVVNLAFASVLKPIVDMSEEEFSRTVDTCLGGAFRISRSAGQVLIRQGRGGSVVHFGSIAGNRALGRGTGAYAAAKAGLEALIREAAVEWGTHGIRVNGIAPCQTRTQPLERLLADPRHGAPGALEQRMVARIPMGRLAEPADMIGACVFLLSDAARMITGHMLPVDGGFLVQ